ncbi:MAG TPA: holin [Candidatus Lumbricidophila sp.]|nr:holin [Candidatus Lumbricidophila sp.]
MFTLTFWKDTIERAIATTAQVAIALLGADGLGVLTVNWPQVGSVASLAGLLAVLKALAAARLGDPGTASLVTVSGGRHAAD